GYRRGAGEPLSRWQGEAPRCGWPGRLPLLTPGSYANLRSACRCPLDPIGCGMIRFCPCADIQRLFPDLSTRAFRPETFLKVNLTLVDHTVGTAVFEVAPQVLTSTQIPTASRHLRRRLFSHDSRLI